MMRYKQKKHFPVCQIVRPSLILTPSKSNSVVTKSTRESAFVCYNHEFVITVTVIFKFDCFSLDLFRIKVWLLKSIKKTINIKNIFGSRVICYKTKMSKL